MSCAVNYDLLSQLSKALGCRTWGKCLPQILTSKQKFGQGYPCSIRVTNGKYQGKRELAPKKMPFPTPMIRQLFTNHDDLPILQLPDQFLWFWMISFNWFIADHQFVIFPVGNSLQIPNIIIVTLDKQILIKALHTFIFT